VTRVLVLIKGLGRGGAEQLLVNALPYLDRRRFEYLVAYLLPHKDAFVPAFRAAGVDVRCLDGRRGPGWIRRFDRLAKERRIDLVHAHSPYAAIGARLALAREQGPSLVYTEHNVWERYHRATYWGNLLTFPRNDHVFAVSEQVRRSIRYPGGLQWRRLPPVETLHHGPDQEAVAGWGSSNGVRRELGIPEDAPVVGTVAHMKVHKGHGTLLRAATAVRREVPGVRFVLVGMGPLEQDVRRQTRELGLDGSVLFAGFREDAPRVAGAFDVFVLPSDHEGLPIALVEAMALGRPPVVTAVGGSPEVVEDGRSGLVVPPRDPEALADRIVTLLRDPALRRRLGDAARLRASRFDIRHAVARMEAVYQDLGR
jgi:glycosyltransferase involved in cell wall biosynthesis